MCAEVALSQDDGCGASEIAASFAYRTSSHAPSRAAGASNARHLASLIIASVGHPFEASRWDRPAVDSVDRGVPGYRNERTVTSRNGSRRRWPPSAFLETVPIDAAPRR
jgi:hypothetical protein